MKTSPAGIDLIKRYEGCRLTAYLDRLAKPPVWTIGYGETGPYVHEGLRYTQEQAETGLIRRLAEEFEPAVNEVAGAAPTTQPQFDAMVSLAWNIGTTAFLKQSSVARFHRQGKYTLAADAFRLWNRAGGVVLAALARRREEERALYLSGLPEAPTAPPPPAPVASDKQMLRDIAAQLLAISDRM